VGWAERWAKAKENHARYRKLRSRTRFFVIGAILAGAGGSNLYSDTMHQRTGRAATATLMEHIKECTVAYQRVGEQKRTETWPCDLAEEFQKRVGQDKIKLSRDYIVRVRFPLADGRTQEARVDDVKLGSYGLDVGATLPVVYAPDNPADVRAAMSWEGLKVPLGLLAVGLVCLALAFRSLLAALLGWAFPARAPHAEDVTVSAAPGHVAPSAASGLLAPPGHAAPTFGRRLR
jgi:uncharacterized protein DUF3592